MVIYQTLYELFPHASFNQIHVRPLAPAEFMQRVLVPEAAVSLIQEDSGQDRERAIETLRESTEYGVSMFPDLSGDAETAADKQMKDRLRAKMEMQKAGTLLEIEEEDDVIADTKSVKVLSRGARKDKPKPKPTPKRPPPAVKENGEGPENAELQETRHSRLDSDVSMHDVVAETKKRKGKGKASNAGGDDSTIEIDDSATNSDTSTRSRTKHISNSRKAYTGGSDRDRVASIMPAKTPKARQRSASVLNLASDSEVDDATPKPATGRKQTVHDVPSRNGATARVQKSSSLIMSGSSHPLAVARARKAVG